MVSSGASATTQGEFLPLGCMLEAETGALHYRAMTDACYSVDIKILKFRNNVAKLHWTGADVQHYGYHVKLESA